MIYESETSTLIKAMGGNHGGFEDTIRRVAENELLSYSRKTGNLTTVIDYPYLSMLLAGTPDQAKSMYEHQVVPSLGSCTTPSIKRRNTEIFLTLKKMVLLRIYALRHYKTSC